MNSVNSETQERLDDLLKTDPNALTASDMEFLQARSSYLTEEQKAALKALPKQQAEANKAEANQDVNTSASAAKVTGAEVEGSGNEQSEDTTSSKATGTKSRVSAATAADAMDATKVKKSK